MFRPLRAEGVEGPLHIAPVPRLGRQALLQLEDLALEPLGARGPGGIGTMGGALGVVEGAVGGGAGDGDGALGVGEALAGLE